MSLARKGGLVFFRGFNWWAFRGNGSVRSSALEYRALEADKSASWERSTSRPEINTSFTHSKKIVNPFRVNTVLEIHNAMPFLPYWLLRSALRCSSNHHLHAWLGIPAPLHPHRHRILRYRPNKPWPYPFMSTCSSREEYRPCTLCLLSTFFFYPFISRLHPTVFRVDPMHEQG